MPFPIQQGLFEHDITDHYAILGVPLDASEQQIRLRYYKIAYILHPDTCKAKNDAEKRRANKLLSKLVNPAYEQLAKERSRLDYLLIAAQVGKNLATQNSKLELVSEGAKQLLQTKTNADLIYHKFLHPLILAQYNDLEQIFQITAQISELNLAYLIVKQGEGIQAKPTALIVKKNEPQESKPEEDRVTPLIAYLRRAQDYLNKNNISQAIAELQEARKIDPKNSSCHGLLGLAYLKQNQIPMAKVHINQAWKLNPRDPVVLDAKQELEKIIAPENKSKPSSSKSPSGESGGGGMFGGLFGGKKK